MEPNRAQIQSWLKDILAANDETPTALARRAGVAQSTLTRFLNSEDAPMLGTRTIAKIAHAAHVDPIGLPSGQAVPGGHVSENDAVPYDFSLETPLGRAIAALINGRAATDPWQIKNRALEDAGLLPGDIAIVSLNEIPRVGDVICAQNYRWAERRAETIFRIYEPPYIIAATREISVRRPLLVDNDRVIIKGVVIDVIRPREAA